MFLFQMERYAERGEGCMVYGVPSTFTCWFSWVSCCTHTSSVYCSLPPLTARCTALPAGHFQHASAYVPTFPPSTTHIYSRQPDHQHQFSASHPHLIIHHSNPSTANNQQLSIHRYLQYSRLPTEISSTWED